MRKPVRRDRDESRGAVAELRDVVSGAGLHAHDAHDARWGLSRGGSARCDRCHRRIRDGEPVLVGCDDARFCGLCGRRHWARRWEDPPTET
jgi:hypothetical protein